MISSDIYEIKQSKTDYRDVQLINLSEDNPALIHLYTDKYETVMRFQVGFKERAEYIFGLLYPDILT